MPLPSVRFEELDKLKVDVATEPQRVTLGCLAMGITDLPRDGTQSINRGDNTLTD